MKQKLLISIFSLLVFPAFAQWTPLKGPATHQVSFADGGRYVLALTSDGVFRSEDEGLHWEIVPDFPRHYSCHSIAASENKDQLVAVLFDDACNCIYYYSSKDQGDSWEKVSTPGFAEYVSAVFSGKDGYILTSTSRIQDNKAIHTNWESFDGGKNWRRNYMDTLSTSPIQDLRLYGNGIWGFSENKLLRGTKQGADWQLVAITPDSLTVGGYLIEGDTLLLNSYGTFYSRLWRSLDAGASWEELPFQKSVLHFQQYGDKLLALNAYGNLISSQDNGANWVLQSADSIALTDFLIKTPNIIAYEYGSGVVYSQDMGKHFTRTQERLGSASIADQMTILENKLYVTNPYALTLGEALPFYDIPHKSWGLSTPPLEKYGYGIITDDIQALNGRLFTCIDAFYTYRSGDKGLSWEACTDMSLWPDVARGTKMLPMGQSLFLYDHLGFTNAFLNRTDDYGQTWVRLDYPDYNLCQSNYSEGIFLGKSKGLLLAALRYGQCLYQSDNLGNSWAALQIPEVPIETDSGFTYITSMVASENMMLLTIGRQEKSKRDYFNFVSFDLGANWVESDAPIGYREASTAILPKLIEYHGLSLLATYGQGVYISQDTGKHWLPYNQGIPSIHVQDIEMDSSNLYVSTWGHGVWSRPLADLDDYDPSTGDSALKISIGPNPSTGLLRIVSRDPIQSAHLQWFDSTGRLCLEQDLAFTCDQTIVELPFPNGAYFYRLKDEKGSRASGKVILLR